MQSIRSCITDTFDKDSCTKPRFLFALAATAGLAYVGYVTTQNYARRRRLLDMIGQKRKQRDDQMIKLRTQLQSGLNDKIRARRKEIVQLGFDRLRTRLQDGELTAVEVLEAFQWSALDAQDKTNFACQFVLEARQWAEEMDIRYAKGSEETKPPLFGIPFSTKECNFLTGYDATSGFAQFLNQPVTQDCELITALKHVGAIPFVTTNLPTTMWSVGCSNSIYGDTRNPFDATRTCGGSSGGEGPVLALRGSPLGIGGDIGGSVRTPAHLCGISALKPTVGRLMGGMCRAGMSGITAVPPTFGPMGLDVDSLVWFMRTLCSSPNAFMYQTDPYVVPMPFDEDVYNGTAPLTIGYYDHDNFMSAAPACRRAVAMARQTLEGRGHRLVAVPFPFDHEEMRWLMEVYVAGVFPDGGSEFAKILANDVVDHAHQSLANYVSTPIWLRKLKARFTRSPYIRTLLQGPESDTNALRAKYASILIIKYKFAKFWEKYNLDAIICPVAATPALPINVPPRFPCIYWSYCALYNLLNFAAGTVRCTRVTPDDEEAALDPRRANRGGLDDDDWVPKLFRECQRGSVGLPVGVQVVTLPFREELCLRVMKELEFGLGF